MFGLRKKAKFVSTLQTIHGLILEAQSGELFEHITARNSPPCFSTNISIYSTSFAPFSFQWISYHRRPRVLPEFPPIGYRGSPLNSFELQNIEIVREQHVMRARWSHALNHSVDAAFSHSLAAFSARRDGPPSSPSKAPQPRSIFLKCEAGHKKNIFTRNTLGPIHIIHKSNLLVSGRHWPGGQQPQR